MNTYDRTYQKFHCTTTVFRYLFKEVDRLESLTWSKKKKYHDVSERTLRSSVMAAQVVLERVPAPDACVTMEANIT